MKDKLKVKVWNYKNVVLFEVLEQDESLRGKDSLFRASNGWTINSNNCPTIYSNIKHINIRGDYTSLDKKVDISATNTIKEAKQLVNEVKQAVKEFNESQREILDKEEKEYLSAVIKPFRSEVEYIEKIDLYDKEYVNISLINENMPFPEFKKNTMYKGMEIGKEYTLKELGL